MRKLLVILTLSMITSPIFAAEQPQQDIKNDQAYGTFNIQKQPEVGKQKQGIDNHFTFFTINIQINGKIKDENSDTTK